MIKVKIENPDTARSLLVEAFERPEPGDENTREMDAGYRHELGPGESCEVHVWAQREFRISELG
jgi:hypothetical protein